MVLFHVTFRQLTRDNAHWNQWGQISLHHWVTMGSLAPVSLLTLVTHWGRMTHIFVRKLSITGSDNVLSPGRSKAIIWTSVDILLFGPLGTNFSEIFIEIQTISLTKIRLKMSSAKCFSFRLSLNVLRWYTYSTRVSKHPGHCSLWWLYNTSVLMGEIRIIMARWHWLTPVHAGFSRVPCSQEYIIVFGKGQPAFGMLSSWHLLHFILFTMSALLVLCLVFFLLRLVSVCWCDISCKTFSILFGMHTNKMFLCRALHSFHTLCLHNLPLFEDRSQGCLSMVAMVARRKGWHRHVSMN